jgi:hypothetical protein
MHATTMTKISQRNRLDDYVIHTVVHLIVRNQVIQRSIKTLSASICVRLPSFIFEQGLNP